MNPKTSHKIVAAGAMVVVIAIATTFVLRSSPTTQATPAVPPAATVAETPAVVPEVPFPAAAAPAPAAEIPAPPAAVAPQDKVAANETHRAARAAPEPAPARKRHVTDDSSDAVVANRAARSEIAVAATEKPAPSSSSTTPTARRAATC